MTASSPRVAVIVVNFNGTDDTHKCLRSLRALDYLNAEIVLVDNGSKPLAGELFAAEYPWVRVIQNPVNGGWAGGNNVGIRDALARGADYFVLLNNDTVVPRALITRLLAGMAAGYDVMGPLVHWMDEPDVVMMDGCFFDAEGSLKFFARPPIAPAPAITEVEIIYGCCLTASAEVFRRIGFLDERFFLIHEESDFCLRAHRAGFRCGVLAESLVWHKGASSFQREGKPLQRYFDARNLFLLMRKHIGYYRRPPRRLRSWLKFLKHVYYAYWACRNKGNEAGATAVLEGLHDAFAGYYGPRKPRSQPFVPLLRWTFERWHRLKGPPA